MKIKHIANLLKSLKREIGDEYRASEEDSIPGMQVTLATNDGASYAYQTGDNSFSGSCYGCKHWHVVYLYRSSNCLELAREAVSELKGMVEEAKTWEQ